MLYGVESNKDTIKITHFLLFKLILWYNFRFGAKRKNPSMAEGPLPSFPPFPSFADLHIDERKLRNISDPAIRNTNFRYDRQRN